MSVPKSVTKTIKKGQNVELTFTDNCDRVQYTMKELCRAALRDVGKYVCKNFKTAYYSRFRRITGNVGRNTKYWVKHKYEEIPSLEVGIKNNGFYGRFQEFGTSRGIARHEMLTRSAQDHISEIIEIESRYLSALEDEAAALNLTSENDYEGGADD